MRAPGDSTSFAERLGERVGAAIGRRILDIGGHALRSSAGVDLPSVPPSPRPRRAAVRTIAPRLAPSAHRRRRIQGRRGSTNALAALLEVAVLRLAEPRCGRIAAAAVALLHAPRRSFAWKRGLVGTIAWELLGLAPSPWSWIIVGLEALIALHSAFLPDVDGVLRASDRLYDCLTASTGSRMPSLMASQRELIRSPLRNKDVT